MIKGLLQLLSGMEREAGEKCFWKLARQAKESENRLNTLLEGNKNQITSKSPNNASSMDKTVQGLRSSLKAQYSALLSMNSVASGDLGVELSLWKNCFYKPIEEHRVKLKAATSSLSSSLSSSPSNGGKTEVGRLRNRFQGFLRSVQDFYNVLLGEMSIVGPRPEREYFIEKIKKIAPHYAHLNKIKPGITSWGQVKYGYAENIEEMVERLKYDLLYVENRSLFLDFKIIIYTVLIVLQGRGK